MARLVVVALTFLRYVLQFTHTWCETSAMFALRSFNFETAATWIVQQAFWRLSGPLRLFFSTVTDFSCIALRLLIARYWARRVSSETRKTSGVSQ